MTLDFIDVFDEKATMTTIVAFFLVDLGIYINDLLRL